MPKLEAIIAYWDFFGRIISSEIPAFLLNYKVK